VFHIELRQFPHQTRSFNLTREELDARILAPWVSGVAVELDDRRWAPDRARLTIYEAPVLSGDQLGLGRGWANVTRQGEDVTARLLAEAAHPPPVAELKREVLARCARLELTLEGVIEIASDQYPQSRVSERLALCEQAVWELLHQQAVQLLRAGEPVAQDEWRRVVLSWEAWRGDGVTVRSAGP